MCLDKILCFFNGLVMFRISGIFKLLYMRPGVSSNTFSKCFLITFMSLMVFVARWPLEMSVTSFSESNQSCLLPILAVQSLIIC